MLRVETDVLCTLYITFTPHACMNAYGLFLIESFGLSFYGHLNLEFWRIFLAFIGYT